VRQQKLPSEARAVRGPEPALRGKWLCPCTLRPLARALMFLPALQATAAGSPLPAQEEEGS